MLTPIALKPTMKSKSHILAESMMSEMIELTAQLQQLRAQLRRPSLRKHMAGDASSIERFVAELNAMQKTLAQLCKQDKTEEIPVIDTTQNMVEKGLLVTPDHFAQLMGWSTRQAVWKALASGRVFAMSLGTQRYFPAFFADTTYERRHLESVSKKLGDLPGGAKMHFFLSRPGPLGGKTVLQALADGQVKRVLELVEGTVAAQWLASMLRRV